MGFTNVVSVDIRSLVLQKKNRLGYQKVFSLWEQKLSLEILFRDNNKTVWKKVEVHRRKTSLYCYDFQLLVAGIHGQVCPLEVVEINEARISLVFKL